MRIKETTQEFWTSQGLRQGCVLSPLLFSIYIAGLEKEFVKRNLGGVRVGRLRIWSLAYADDMVILAVNHEAMLDMIDTLRKFLSDRDLMLSTEKTKMLVFNKARQSKKKKSRWEGDNIEEVDSFRYLGFNFNWDCIYKLHIAYLRKKGNVVVRKTWGLGERKCHEDVGRRKMLFNYLVRSVMSYGAEMWGWSECKELEKVQCDYYRWMLKLDFTTLTYLISRETNISKMKNFWAVRAFKFEEKILKQDVNKLAQVCLLEKMSSKIL